MASMMSDASLLHALKELVKDCFNNWDRWVYSDRGEIHYTVHQVRGIYRDLQSPKSIEQARKLIWSHARLTKEFLKSLGQYQDF